MRCGKQETDGQGRDLSLEYVLLRSCGIFGLISCRKSLHRIAACDRTKVPEVYREA